MLCSAVTCVLSAGLLRPKAGPLDGGIDWSLGQPWQYDENIQAGTDYADQKEVTAYDARMQKLRDVAAK